MRVHFARPRNGDATPRAFRLTQLVARIAKGAEPGGAAGRTADGGCRVRHIHQVTTARYHRIETYTEPAAVTYREPAKA